MQFNYSLLGELELDEECLRVAPIRGWFRLFCLLSLCAPVTNGYSLTQSEITSAALSRFNSVSASYSWDTQLNQYLNGVPPGSPQYEAGLLSWGETYAVTAQQAMFDATGDTQYLDLLLTSAETMYANRADRLNPVLIDEQRNQVMPAFISFNLNQGANAKQHAWLVHSGYVSHPVTKAIATINSDPQLQAQYGTRADVVTADIIETMDSFDTEFSLISGGRGVYYEPYLDFYAPFTNGQTPYNMQNAAGLTYIALWKATGEQRFYDRAEALAKTMKTELTPVSDRYRWRYAPYNSTGSTSDISHAGLDVSFMVDAYEAGIVFDDTDMQRLANTMRFIEQAPGFTPRLDGVGPGQAAQIRLASLWLKLTRYDAALRQEMFPVFDNYWSANSGLWPTLGTSLLYETGQAYTERTVFADSFDGLQLDPHWRRPATQPIGNTWTAKTTGSQLVVSEINSSTSSAQWIDMLRTQDVDQDDSWEVSYDFTWDSTNGATDPLQAMQRFSVDLHDPVGELIASVGINDGWNNHAGGRVIELFDQTIVDPFDSISLAGSASIKIISDALTGISSVYWDDILMLAVPQTFNLDQVGLNFGHYGGLSVISHFGTIAVDTFSVDEPVTALLADFDLDGDVDGNDFLAWQRGFGTAGGLTNGDANNSGFVDEADLAIWQTEFGATALSAGNVTVPEPSAWFYLTASLLLCIGKPRSLCLQFR